MSMCSGKDAEPYVYCEEVHNVIRQNSIQLIEASDEKILTSGSMAGNSAVWSKSVKRTSVHDDPVGRTDRSGKNLSFGRVEKPNLEDRGIANRDLIAGSTHGQSLILQNWQGVNDSSWSVANCKDYIWTATELNLLKPTCYVMHQQFNIQQLYALPTLYLCVLYLSQNKQFLVPLTS